jgi:pantoate--beta-alanine ligase
MNYITNPASQSTMQIIYGGDELRRAVRDTQRSGLSVGLIPTMGALHQGHLSLVDAARVECNEIVATIFVNPTQFGPSEDIDKYPFDLKSDQQLLQQHGCDRLFVPSVAEMYLPRHDTWVEVGAVANGLEGLIRPIHFRGVATIVMKLLMIVPADYIYLGQKDYQQTLVIQQMIADLNIPVTVRICPTVRDSDGLAISSRNNYLNVEERQQAGTLFQSLQLAEHLVVAGEQDPQVLALRMREQLATAPLVELEYIEFVVPGSITPVERVDGPTVVAIAAQVGQTRLIDNSLIG